VRSMTGSFHAVGSGPKRAEVLRDVDLSIAEGEFVAIIGYSGSGKTTLMSLIAGLARPDRGTVILRGETVTAPGPDRAIVFQNHSLLPWLTVYGNVAIAVDKVFGQGQGRGKTRAERHDWVMHNLELVQMAQAKDKRPHEVSGGMKQRVGIARALAMRPRVLLMDEPFGALDALTRAHLQDSVMEIHARLGNTVMMITHDVDEAVLLSDRIVMMTNGPAATIGEVVQVALPRPRDRLALAENAEFNHYRRQVLDFLYAAQRPARKLAPVAQSARGASGDTTGAASGEERATGATVIHASGRSRHNGDCAA